MINTLNDKTKIIKKYHFKEKTVKTILNKRHGPRQLFMEDYSFNIYNGCTFINVKTIVCGRYKNILCKN